MIGVEDVDAAFGGLSLDRQRAVVNALVSITVHPSGRRCGRVYRREDIDIKFHGQP